MVSSDGKGGQVEGRSCMSVHCDGIEYGNPSITKLTATRRKLRGLKDLSTGSVTPAAIAFPPILIALRFNASFPLRPFVEDDLAATSSDSDRVKDGWGCDGKR